MKRGNKTAVRGKSVTPPPNSGVGLRAYARHRQERGLPGSTDSAVRKAIRSGRIAAAVGDDGLIDAARADSLWVANTRAALRPGRGNGTSRPHPSSLEYATARAKLTAARAAQAEHELAVLRREYAHISDVERAVAAPLEAVAAALKNVPARHASALARVANITVAQAQRLLADAMEEVRTTLRQAAGDAD